jgi:ribosome-binding ATPase YchF (GTP1/OBG family)
MAQPVEEVLKFRNKVNELVDDLRDIDAVLAVIEDHGDTDAERAAVFNVDGVFGIDTDNKDLDWATFASGLQAIRDVRTAWDAGKSDIVKLVR